MSYDKTLTDGTKIQAPLFTSRVLDSVPVIFQIFEWLLVIVAFQYADVRFGFIAAKAVWLGLSATFALYFGVLVSNVQWRFFEDPFKNKRWKFFTYILSPLTSGLVVLGLQHLVKQMVEIQS